VAESLRGFWRLEHRDLAALLARSDLSWESARVYLALADLTVGFGKTKDLVSLSQIAEHAALTTPQVARALRRLKGLALCGDAPGTKDGRVRWVVWPPPATDGAVSSDKAVSSATGGAVSGTTDKTTDGAVRHQDTKNGKKPRAASPAGRSEKPKLNAWALWVRSWREARPGDPDPAATGPDTRAGRELAKLVPDEAELRRVFAACLADPDPFLVKNGHALRHLPGRLSAYRGTGPSRAAQASGVRLAAPAGKYAAYQEGNDAW